MHLILKIYGQSSFRRFDLNAEFAFAISIQNKGSYSVVLRPDFCGRRLDRGPARRAACAPIQGHTQDPGIPRFSTVLPVGWPRWSAPRFASEVAQARVV